MPIDYSKVIDEKEVSRIIGKEYVNAAKFVAAGLVDNQGIVNQGTADEWIRESLFQGNPDGQMVSIGSEFSLTSKDQQKYQIPKLFRGDAAILDPIFDEISSKAPRDIETEFAQSIRVQAGQILDGVFAKIVDGFGAYAKAGSINYVDDKSNQISMPKLLAARAKRKDMSMFNGNGIVVGRSDEINKLYSTAQVAATANVVGLEAQDSVTRSGRFVNDSVLGFELLMTDRIALDAGDSKPFVYIIERGGIGAKFSGALNIDPLIKEPRRTSYTSTFWMSVAAGIKGLSYSGTINDKVSLSALATGANWGLAAADAKFIKAVVLAVNTTSL